MSEDKMIVAEKELRREYLRQYLTSDDSVPDPIPGQFFPTESDLNEELLRISKMAFRLRKLYKVYNVNLVVKLDKTPTQSRKHPFGMPKFYGGDEK